LPCRTFPGAGFAYFAVMAGVFVTAFYSFRMYFLVFHGEERFGKAAHDAHHRSTMMVTTMTKRLRTIITMVLAPGQKPHETPWVVTLPLVLLAIPSLFIGYIAIGPMVFGDYFKGVIFTSISACPSGHGAFGRALPWCSCDGRSRA
jgi:NADH-quinone oxidoreductase subunit L